MPERLHAILLAIAIFMYSGVLVQNELLPIPVSWFNIGALAITVFVLIPRFKHVLEFASGAKSLVIFTILAVISTIWSINPEITLNRAIILVGASSLGIYIASQYTIKQQIIFYSRILIVSMLASYFVAIVFPESGVHQLPFHFGRWRGITIHKNVLGEWMSLCIVMLIFLPDEYLKIPKYLKYAFIVLSIILLSLTVSLTSIFTVLIIALLYPILLIQRWDFRLKTAIILYALAITLLIIILVSLNFADLLIQLGRTPTLSGRSIIWPVVLTLISARPLLGYGYMSFFVPEIYLVDTIFTDVWRPEHAHNVWLDTAMDFGMIGVILLVFIIIRGLQQAYILYVRHYQTEVLLVLLMLFNILARSMTETFAMRRRDIIWIMFVSLLLRLHHEYQLRHQVKR